MKSQLCSGVVVLFIAVLSATAAYADEPGTDGEEEALTEPGEPDKPAEPATALLESEVLRYYRGIGAEPTEAELKSALDAASDMVLADVAIEQISLAVDEAIRRHESGVDVPFTVVVPRLVQSRAKTLPAEGDASEAVRPPAWRAPADQNIEDLRTTRVGRLPSSGTRGQMGTGLMLSALAVQGISLGTTVASLFDPGNGVMVITSWVVQAISIPFAPLGVRGFALRFGGWSETERLRWTGIGLLEAAGYSVLVGIPGLVAMSSGAFQRASDLGMAVIFLVPGMVAHLAAAAAFLVAGGVCVGVAQAQVRRQGKSQSRRPAARGSHRGFVMPTIAPRPDGLSLGLAGVF